MKIEKLSEKLAIFFYFLCFLGSIIVIFFWFLEKPLFYTASGPVMSIFTALSLCILSGIRLAKRFLFGWPMTTTLGLMVFVMGGNISSVLMMTSFPHILADTQSSIVMTSVFTSLGILLFGSYELLLIIRKTPKHIFILDDILIHLALVPGGLSLLGHLLNNPAYISLGIDPRVGISLLEMSFMASFAAATILSNPNLFLWQFLRENISNKIIFIALFSNQFIAPILYAYFIAGKSSNAKKPGLELFIMIAGVFATLSFLMIQAYNLNNPTEKEAIEDGQHS